jgi:hypothetical protein
MEPIASGSIGGYRWLPSSRAINQPIIDRPIAMGVTTCGLWMNAATQYVYCAHLPLG